jgi:hypothetical protein
LGVAILDSPERAGGKNIGPGMAPRGNKDHAALTGLEE